MVLKALFSIVYCNISRCLLFLIYIPTSCAAYCSFSTSRLPCPLPAGHKLSLIQLFSGFLFHILIILFCLIYLFLLFCLRTALLHMLILKLFCLIYLILILLCCNGLVFLLFLKILSA